MASPPNSDRPIVLFPLKLETRFVGNELWIRAFPDVAFLQSHDPILTIREQKSMEEFRAILDSSEEKLKVKWAELVSKYGVYRAAWIIELSKNPPTEPFDPKIEDKAPDFYFKWLPDQLVFYFYKKDDSDKPEEEKDKDILVGKKEGKTINRDGLVILQEQEEGEDEENKKNWIKNFQAAVNAGMGVKIITDEIGTTFEKIIVCGLRSEDDPFSPALGLSNLFRNHQFTEGFSFLEYGTATNNTDTAKSAYSIRDEFDAESSFDYAVNGLELETTPTENAIEGVRITTAGQQFAKGLGLETADFKHIKHADIQESKLTELFQKASWFALGAQPLFMLFGNQISSEMHLEIWNHYAKYVKGKGHYSALKIGNQPYGVLPILNIRRPLDEDIEGGEIRNSDQLLDKLWHISAHLLKRWIKMVKENSNRIPRLGDEEDSYMEILKILSMQEYSTTYQIRGLEYTWFQKRLTKWLQQLPADTPFDALQNFVPVEGIFKDDFTVLKNRKKSLESLLPEDSVNEDLLFHAPILNMEETPADLIGFKNEKAVLHKKVEEEGITKIKEIPLSEENAFSLTEEDLTHFQAFIDLLKRDKTENLFDFQYKGELSLFTDLFLRSYANACQLYHRDIAFEPTTNQRTGFPYYTIGNILKTAGESVAKGDIILEILAHKTRTDTTAHKTIQITAPFDGKIEKVHRKEKNDDGTAVEIQPTYRLFSLKNAAAFKKIKTEFIQLGEQIIKECNRLGNGDEGKEILKKAQMEAIREALDLNSYRIDAWMTSLAARRLDDMRNRPDNEEDKDFDKGLYFGAYGWVEHLSKNEENPIDSNVMTDIYKGEGGIIHTPNSAQAVASAIFKNSFLSYREEGPDGTSIEASNPFTLNLTSDRLQKSAFLLDGIRQGQQLEALLGYQLERYLHEHPNGGLHTVIYELREKFPLYENVSNTTADTTGFVNLSVINGLEAIKNKDNLPLSNGKKAIVKKYIEKLEDVLDGSLDTLFYEAGYQTTQGNLSQAAAALDATKGEVEPPEIESLKTKITGVGLSHKLLLLFNAPTTTYPLENCRAFAEPVLENWLEKHLGGLDKIGCEVDLVNAIDDSFIDTIPVKLSDLNIGYLDFLYLSDTPASDGASELEVRIWHFIKTQKADLPDSTQYQISTFAPQGCQPLSSALEVARYAYDLWSKSQYLKTEDLHKEGALDDLTIEKRLAVYDFGALEAIKTGRLVPIIERLKAIQANDFNKKSTLEFLSKIDLDIAKIALFGNVPIEIDELLAALFQKITAAEAALALYNSNLPFYTAFEHLETTAKILFGKTFMLLPPATCSDSFKETIQSQEQHRLIGAATDNTNQQVWGQECLKNWMQGLAQVRENVEVLEDWMMVNKVWKQQIGLVQKEAFQVVQYPTLLQYPWVGLSKKEMDEVINTHHSPATIYKHPATKEAFPLADGTYYPDGCESMVIYAEEDLILEKNGINQPIFGLLIDSFSEHIPNETVNTGVSFHYNAPNNEPPQAILLAVHPLASENSSILWDTETLQNTLYDTMDLYKTRMVDTEAITEYGYLLPMANWMNIPS